MSDAILAGWVALCVVMFVQRRLRNELLSERAPGTWAGIVVQALGFSAVFMIHGPHPAASATWLVGLGDACGIAAIVLGTWAIWTLGRQWSVAGRVLPEHALIQHGPYAVVRHPIYTAMFGMLLATAVSLGSWPGLAVGATLYAIGTAIRVRFEERLLRHRFGDAFDRYAAGVPAFLPGTARLRQVFTG